MIMDSHHVRTHETDCVQYQTLDWRKVQQKQSITDFVHWGTLKIKQEVSHTMYSTLTLSFKTLQQAQSVTDCVQYLDTGLQ